MFIENQNNQTQNPNPTPPVSPSGQTSQTPQSSNPIKPASKFSVKAIIGVIIFLLLAGGAAAGFVFKPQIIKLVSKPTPTPTQTVVQTPTPTPDPTANWKTYSNKDFNFSFQYPSYLTLQKVDKSIFESTDFDNEKISVTQYSPAFTSGKMVQNDPSLKPYKDISWLVINVEPTNGKTIMQAFNNQKGFGGTTKVSLLKPTGNADEMATVTNIESLIRVYRKGSHFITLGYPQDGSLEITNDTNLEQILSTFKFTDKTGSLKTLDPSSVLKSIAFTGSNDTKKLFVIYKIGKSVTGEQMGDAYISDTNFGNPIKIQQMSNENYPDSPAITITASPGGGKRYIEVNDDRHMQNWYILDEDGIMIDNAADGAAFKAVEKSFGSIGQNAAGFEKWLDNHTYSAKVLDAYGNNYHVTIDASTNLPIGKPVKL